MKIYTWRGVTLIPNPTFLLSPVDIQLYWLLGFSFLCFFFGKINICLSIFLYLLSYTKDSILWIAYNFYSASLTK